MDRTAGFFILALLVLGAKATLDLFQRRFWKSKPVVYWLATLFMAAYFAILIGALVYTLW